MLIGVLAVGVSAGGNPKSKQTGLTLALSGAEFDANRYSAV